MNIKPIRADIKEFIAKHNLNKKWNKVAYLFETNIRHSSLDFPILTSV